MADVIAELAAGQAAADEAATQLKETQPQTTDDDNTPLATPPSPTPTEAVHPAETLQTRQKPYRTRATCPDPGSLYDILRENCGRSLFVLPILWTDMHPRLLRAEFVANEPILDDIHLSPPTSSGTARDARAQRSRADEELSYNLTSLLSAPGKRPFVSARAIKDVLSALFPTLFSRPKSNPDLDLHFGDRVFRMAVHISVLWSSPSGAGSSFDSAVTRAVSSFGHASNSELHSSSQGALDEPTVAYVDRAYLAIIRQNLFRIVPGPDSGNAPVARLQSLRSKQLTPPDCDRDPYLIGVFLGMAQAHFYESTPSRTGSQSQARCRNRAQRNCRMTPVTEFRDVKLRIVMYDEETNDFIVYTTTVTPGFLKKFAEPTKNTATSDAAAHGMKIEYTRVPVWPILGLRARLGKALGKDLVGELEEEESDGADCEGPVKDDKNKNDKTDKELLSEDRGTRVDSLKRKRSERKSYAEVLSGEAQGGAKGVKDVKDVKDVKEDIASASGASSSAVSSPMSPRTKRRQTRSLSSSLAVC